MHRRIRTRVQIFAVILFFQTILSFNSFATDCSDVKQNPDGTWQPLKSSQILDHGARMPAPRCQYAGTCYLEAALPALSQALPEFHAPPEQESPISRMDHGRLAAMVLLAEDKAVTHGRVQKFLENPKTESLLSGGQSYEVFKAVFASGQIPLKDTESLGFEGFDAALHQHVLQLQSKGLSSEKITEGLRNFLSEELSPKNRAFADISSLRLNAFNHFPHQDSFFDLADAFDAKRKKVPMPDLSQLRKEQLAAKETYQAIAKDVVQARLLVGNIRAEPDPKQKAKLEQDLAQHLASLGDKDAYFSPSHIVSFKTYAELDAYFDSVMMTSIRADLDLERAERTHKALPLLDSECPLRARAIATELAAQLCAGHFPTVSLWSSGIRNSNGKRESGGMHALVIKGMSNAPDGTPVFHLHNTWGELGETLSFQDACLIKEFLVVSSTNPSHPPSHSRTFFKRNH